MSAAIARRYYARGKDELARGEVDAAAESFRGALELYPSFVSARIALAIALLRQSDPPRAAQSLRAGLARAVRDHDRAALFQQLGDVLVASGDFLGAEDAFRQVLELRPGDAAAQGGLARVYAKLGRYGDSFEALLTAARAR